MIKNFTLSVLLMILCGSFANTLNAQVTIKGIVMDAAPTGFRVVIDIENVLFPHQSNDRWCCQLGRIPIFQS